MCYYNGQKVTREEYIRLKDMEKAVSRYDFLDHAIHNGFAYAPIAVLKPNEAKNDFDIVQMIWGFLPPYLRNMDAVNKFRNGYKNEQGKYIPGYTTLNAKAENLFTSEKGAPSIFADAARNRRCLVLSTGFYEWRHVFPLNKRTGEPVKTAIKYPYYISLKNQEYFFFLGIHQEWTDKDTGETVDTVAVITCDANSKMRIVHNSKNRMPSIPTPDLAYEWLMHDLTDERITEIAKSQYPAEEMQACTIAKDFRESLEPATPFIYEDLPALELNL